jgi:hypothetical protein
VLAAIDYLAIARPAPASITTSAAHLAIRLGYDDDMAVGLALRVMATARMFATHEWATIRTLGRGLAPLDRILFEHAVQRFIAAAPLDEHDGFDTDTLLRSLTAQLPPAGHG